MGSSKSIAQIRSASVLTVFLLVSPFCQAQPRLQKSREVPYDSSFGPGFYEVSINREYPGSYERIEAVDFRNLILELFDESKHFLLRAELKNGRYDIEEEGTWDEVKLDSIYYLPSQDSHHQFALVLYTWFTAAGSSSTEGIAQIYELQAGQLKAVQQLGWDEHFYTDRPYASFDEKSHVLTVRSAHYMPGDSVCCVSAVDVVTVRWNESRFLKKRVWVELSKSAVREGKKL